MNNYYPSESLYSPYYSGYEGMQAYPQQFYGGFGSPFIRPGFPFFRPYFPFYGGFYPYFGFFPFYPFQVSAEAASVVGSPEMAGVQHVKTTKPRI